MANQQQQQRFLVNRTTLEVFVWTQMLSSAFPDFEEVYATNAEEARQKKAMPDPRTISIERLEEMSKADLLIFAKVKLGLDLKADQTKEEIGDAIKENVFVARAAAAPAEAAVPNGRPNILGSTAEMVAKAEAEAAERARQANEAADEAERKAVERITAAKKQAEEAEERTAQTLMALADAEAKLATANEALANAGGAKTGGDGEGAGPDQPSGA